MKKLFIDGNWIEAEKYETLYSPYSGETISEIPVANKSEVDKAINAAYCAQKKMRKLPAHERARILYDVSQLLLKRLDEAAKIISLESAKPLKASKAEVLRTVQTYLFASDEAKKLYGETIPLDAAPGGENRLAYTKKYPLGVIGAITPFNFPMNLVAHKVGPAIAAGNTVVLKPASQTPLSAYFIAELFEEAGLPKGALNVISGKGSVIGDLLVKDDRIKMITFTGSPAVGKQIQSKAGLKKVTLELGSNSGLIIDKDVDIDKIIDRTVMGAFSNQGQVCISLQRIYVHESLYEMFVEKFIEASKQLKVGDPLDPETDISALISSVEKERITNWINEATSAGAHIRSGGNTKASILQPTVLTDVDNSLKVSCQEAFAPIVIINKISSVSEGIELVNDSIYGLQAGIYTQNINEAMKAADLLEVGAVLINDIPTFRVDHMPYGGVKESGTGREGLKYAVEEMTELKLVIINHGI